jgi:nucleoside-diphosphate-sugar epimerase
MNILITGASGLVGSHLIQKLNKESHNIICQSRNHHDEPMAKWVKHDLINDSWEDLALPQLNVVYHLAGQTSTYKAKESPIEDLTINVIGLLRLLEYLRKQRIPAFVVLAGTATEVGLTDRLPINESFPDNPITFYDISKLTAEMYLKQYIREGWIKGCALRLANVFGRSLAAQQKDRGIIDKIFNRAILGQNVTIYGDGNFLRDYIYIEDVVSAFILAAKNIEATNGRTFYIGSGKGLTLKDAFLKVVAVAEKISGTRAVIEHVQPPTELSAIEYRHAVIDSSAFQEATGWTPRFDFETGIQAAYNPASTLLAS